MKSDTYTAWAGPDNSGRMYKSDRCAQCHALSEPGPGLRCTCKFRLQNRLVSALLIALFPFLGCCSNRHFTVNAFTDESIAIAAANEWNDCQNPDVSIQIVRGKGDFTLIPVGEIPGKPDKAGMYDGVDRIYYTIPNKTVLAHEMGHMLGLSHQPRGIMAHNAADFNAKVSVEDCGLLYGYQIVEEKPNRKDFTCPEPCDHDACSGLKICNVGCCLSNGE